MRHTFALLYQALYQPQPLIDYLQAGGRKARLHVIFSSLVPLVATYLIIFMLLPALIPLRVADQALIMLSIPFIALICAATLQMTGHPSQLENPATCIFWFCCCQLCMTPLLMLGSLWIMAPSVARHGSLSEVQLYLLTLLLGLALGSVFCIYVCLRQTQRPLIDDRWAIVLLGIPIALALWFLPLAQQTLWMLLVPFLLGFIVAQLRLVSWLWQACLALSVRLRYAVNHNPGWLRRRYPLAYDGYRLLPLPGTGAVLWQLYQADRTLAIDVMVERVAHPPDWSQIRRCFQRIFNAAQAHRLCVDLSVHPKGHAVLKLLAGNKTQAAALAQLYLELGSVGNAALWAHVLPPISAKLTPASLPADLGWLGHMLQVATAVLHSRTYAQAVQGLAETPLATISPMLIQPSLQTLVAYAAQPDHENNPADLEPVLRAAGPWPITLIAVLAEQISFLQELETRQYNAL